MMMMMEKYANELIASEEGEMHSKPVEKERGELRK
jgi:hypothetical protein